MSRPASAHPLDMELFDYVEGACDAETADRIAAHLAQCLLCRIKRQRLAEAPPMELYEKFVLEEVRTGAPIIGLYPPTDPESLERFEAWKNQSRKTSMEGK